MRVEREGADARRPSRSSPAGSGRAIAPGQYLRLGVEVDGVHHWRAYSLTSDPGRAGRAASRSRRSSCAAARSRRSCAAACGRARSSASAASKARSCCPTRCRARLLFISAGSGITPIMSMLRDLDRARRAARRRAHPLRARPRRGDLRRASCASWTRRAARLPPARCGSPASRAASTPAAARSRCAPTGASARRFLCGPAGLLEAMREHWDARRRCASACTSSASSRSGARRRRARRRRHDPLLRERASRRRSDGEEPILARRRARGRELPYGCRMGICHSCVGRLRSGRVRDLRTGRVHGQPGEIVQTCINAPEGAVEIDL